MEYVKAATLSLRIRTWTRGGHQSCHSRREIVSNVLSLSLPRAYTQAIGHARRSRGMRKRTHKESEDSEACESKMHRATRTTHLHKLHPQKDACRGGEHGVPIMRNCIDRCFPARFVEGNDHHHDSRHITSGVPGIHNCIKAQPSNNAMFTRNLDHHC